MIASPLPGLANIYYELETKSIYFEFKSDNLSVKRDRVLNTIKKMSKCWEMTASTKTPKQAHVGLCLGWQLDTENIKSVQQMIGCINYYTCQGCDETELKKIPVFKVKKDELVEESSKKSEHYIFKPICVDYGLAYTPFDDTPKYKWFTIEDGQ